MPVTRPRGTRRSRRPGVPRGGGPPAERIGAWHAAILSRGTRRRITSRITGSLPGRHVLPVSDLPAAWSSAS